MHIDQFAAWRVIASLSLLLVGGLALWTYKAGRVSTVKFAGPDAAAAKRFHQRLTYWFIAYGCVMIVCGAGLLLWSARPFL